METIITMLIFAIIFGFITRAMAKKRGRDANIGFLMGLLFGIFAIIGYLILGETEEKRFDRLVRAQRESFKDQ